jgi:hypothetical protein
MHVQKITIHNRHDEKNLIKLLSLKTMQEEILRQTLKSMQVQKLTINNIHKNLCKTRIANNDKKQKYR